MRSTPPLLALALAATLPSCSTWPPRRVPEPTPSVVQPVQGSSEVNRAIEDGSAGPAAAAAPGGPGAADEPDADTARTARDDAARPETAQSPDQDAGAGSAVGASVASAQEPARDPEPGADAAARTEDAPAAATPTVAEAVPEAAGEVVASHPLGARSSHVGGTELFGADVADAEGAVLGRLFDLRVKPDGSLDCMVLLNGEGRRTYSSVDLALDDQGGLRLESGDRCGPSDPLRNGAPYRELFVGRQTSTVVGQLTAVETIEGGGTSVTVIKLRAANNHHHRVLVGPTAFLTEHALLLTVDQEVSIDGIETRDSKGKLWVAGALRAGGRELRLRSGNGQPAWDPSLLPIRQDDCCRDLDGSLLSTFDLARWRVRIEGAPELVPCDLVFDRRIEAAFLVVHHEGVERLVPWSAATLGAGRTLSLEVGPAVIAGAPTLPQVTADDRDPWQGVRDFWIFAARPVQAAATPAQPAEPAPEDKAGAGDEPRVEVEPPSGDGDGLEAPDGAQR